jgi:hypothetical protein
MRRFSVLPIAMLAALAAVSCDADPAGVSAVSTPSRPAPSSPTPTPTPTEVTASPTPPALPQRSPQTRGEPSSTCVNGWETPAEDSRLFTDPLGIVRRTAGVDGPLEVVDMRTFVGPESPPSDKGYLIDIQRWYIKLYAADDLAFQGRFLVEQRRFGRGVAAVAPYDTRGFRSPDWRGFQYDSSARRPLAVPGLPGTWSGVEYDFVKGGEGLDLPGLPPAVVGCLEAS